MSLQHDKWYALQVRSNSEAVAERSLQERGYVVFAPTMRAWHKWTDRVKVLRRPMFPGYVFCRFDATKPYRMVDTPAVLRIIGFGGVPMPVDDAELASLHLVADANVEMEPSHYLREGQKARVCSGSLLGLEGIVIRQKDRHWIVLQVTLLQRAISVCISSDALMPVQ